jgi:hypothetical protein
MSEIKPVTWYDDPAHFRKTSRREFLYVGLVGGLGLSLGNFFKLRAEEAALTEAIAPKAQSLIHIFLPGGSSAQEMWDPKPFAPIEYRGPMGTIDTKLSGVQFSEHMKHSAKIADKITIVRSMTHGEAAHERGTHNMFTGYRPSPAIQYPAMGSVISHELGSRNNLPPYVCIPNTPNEYAGSGYLSSAHGPFSLGADPASKGFEVRDLNMRNGITQERFDRRRNILSTVDEHFRTLEKSDALTAMDSFYQSAYNLVSSKEARESFNLTAEPEAIRKEYGEHSAGQRMLMARRLVEGGVRFVSLTYGSWDMHANIASGIKSQVPEFDQAYAALITDLDPSRNARQHAGDGDLGVWSHSRKSTKMRVAITGRASSPWPSQAAGSSGASSTALRMPPARSQTLIRSRSRIWPRLFTSSSASIPRRSSWLQAIARSISCAKARWCPICSPDRSLQVMKFLTSSAPVRRLVRRAWEPNLLPRLSKGASAAAALALLTVSTSALAGSPRVTSVYPSGGQRGAEIEIECKGSNLEDATGILFSDAGFESVPVAAEKGKFKVKVKVPAEARLGEHTMRVVTASGIGDMRLFYVSPFAMVPEEEVKEQPEKAQPVALGTTVYGRTQNDDADGFEVEVKKGQRITAEVIGARLQTQQIYDPQVRITKADGTLLAEIDDTAFTRQDPVVSAIAPEDGKYVVTVKEATNTGTGECHYLLNVGSFPRPLAVYPPGGPAGEELQLQLVGDAAGPIAKSVKLPNAAAERFQIYVEDGQPAPQPNFIRISKFPNVLETEPNNDVNHATVAGIPLPLALNGVISEAGDADSFKFTAQKAKEYEVNVFARQLRSPLDSVMEIYDLKGARLATNDDSGGPDSYLRWKAPADGEFYLTVRDQLRRGGHLFTYRIEIQPVQPRVTAWLPEMVQNSNQERRAIVVPKGNRYASLVRVKRADFGGGILLEPRDLPPGVKAIVPPVDKGVDTVPVVFEAAADAAPAVKTFSFQPKLAEARTDITVESGIEHEVDVAENGNQKSFYAVKEDRFAIKVADEVPVKLKLVQPKVPVLQSGSIDLKVVAERQGDFKGAISLALLYSPPGTATAGTLQIKEGENEAVVTVSAADKAALQTWPICIVGSADFGKGPVWVSTQMAELEIAAPYVAGQIVRTFVDQGDTATVTVKLDHKQPLQAKRSWRCSVCRRTAPPTRKKYNGGQGGEVHRQSRRRCPSGPAQTDVLPIHA